MYNTRSIVTGQGHLGSVRREAPSLHELLVESVSEINVYNVYSNRGGLFRLEGVAPPKKRLRSGIPGRVPAAAHKHLPGRRHRWPAETCPAPPSLAPPPALLRRRVAGVPGLEGRGVAGGWAGRARAGGLVRWRRCGRAARFGAMLRPHPGARLP